MRKRDPAVIVYPHCKIRVDSARKLTDANWLRAQAGIRSDKTIALALRVPFKAVAWYRDLHGIPEFIEPTGLPDEDELRALCIKYTDSEVADMFRVDPLDVKEDRHRYGIPTRTQYLRDIWGKKHRLIELILEHEDDEICEMLNVRMDQLTGWYARFELDRDTVEDEHAAADARATMGGLRREDGTVPTRSEVQIIATCTACRWTMTVLLNPVAQNKYVIEPDRKIRMDGEGGILHVECGRRMQLLWNGKPD